MFIAEHAKPRQSARCHRESPVSLDEPFGLMAVRGLVQACPAAAEKRFMEVPGKLKKIPKKVVGVRVRG